MALQGLTIEAAFTATPFADPSTLTWTDLSTRGLHFSMNRGRQYELTQMQAGSCQIVLQNLDGYLDPDNGSSPYSPYVLPMTPVRISATYSGTTYRLFYGFVESWVQQWSSIAPRFGTVTVTASDGLKAVLSFGIGLGYTEKLVQDYGGTIGVANTNFWPWDGAEPLNYYLSTVAPSGNVVGQSNPTGIALTCMKLSGSGSYYQYAANQPTATYITQWESWHRIDTAPAFAGALMYSGDGGSNTTITTLGYGAGASSIASQDDNACSVWAFTLPANLLAAAVADPTSTTGWSVSTGTGTLSTATATAANVVSSIWTDTGGSNLYGATSVLKATITASGAMEITSPKTAVTAGQGYTFSASFVMSVALSATLNVFADWYTSGGTLISSSTVYAAGTLGANVVRQTVGTATAPSTAATVALRFSTSQTAASYTVQVGQLLMWASTANGTGTGVPQVLWQAPGAATSYLAVQAMSGQNIAPTGQTAAAGTVWPCWAYVARPAVGSWFHVAIDTGRDNAGAPASTTGVRMPSVWVNGASVRMFTVGSTNSYSGSGFDPVIGAKFYNASGTPTLLTASVLACSIDETYMAGGNGVQGRVTAAQALDHYNYGLTRHDFVQELTGSRVGDVLTALGWPTALRSIDTGTVSVLQQLPDTSSTSTNLTGLSLIQDANSAEGGLYYVARDGTFTFWDRNHTMPSVSITIGDNGTTEIPYQPGVKTSKDDTYIYNLITLTQKVTDGSTGTVLLTQAGDQTSQTQYKVRSAPSVSAPWVQLSDMTSLASAVIADYKQPHTRVAGVSVNAVTATTPANVFASLLPRDIGDQIAVNIRPVGGTPTVAVSAYLQGLGLSVDPQNWLFTFSLSPTLTGH